MLPESFEIGFMSAFILQLCLQLIFLRISKLVAIEFQSPMEIQLKDKAIRRSLVIENTRSCF